MWCVVYGEERLLKSDKNEVPIDSRHKKPRIL